MNPARPIIGIDPDTRRLACAAVCGRKVLKVSTIERKSAAGDTFHPDFFWRKAKLFKWAKREGAAVFVEDIYLGENVETFQCLAGVQGALLEDSARFGVPVVFVPAAEWRGAVLGVTRGRDALKEAARAKARALGVPVASEHEAEALCIALYGQRAVIGQARRVAQ